MQTEEILEKIWTQIQSFGGVRFTSTIKTRLDQERDITVNFSLPATEEHPLLDRTDEEDLTMLDPEGAMHGKEVDLLK